MVLLLAESIQQIKSIIAQLQGCLESQGYHAMEAMFADIASVDSDCGSAQKGGSLFNGSEYFLT
jgi:hypothetical protein